MLQLVISLLPTLVSLIHTVEGQNLAPGNGPAKQQSVLDLLKALLEAIIPQEAVKIEAILNTVSTLIPMIVQVLNVFGWNSTLLQQAAVILSPTQPPAPVV